MARHTGVKGAVAVLHVTGTGGPASGREDRGSGGYVVTQPGATLRLSDLARYLREQLPPPMVPAHLMILDALPLSANGKVDRKALPPPSKVERAHRPETATGDTLHELIARVWADVLGDRKSPRLNSSH